MHRRDLDAGNRAGGPVPPPLPALSHGPRHPLVKKQVQAVDSNAKAENNRESAIRPSERLACLPGKQHTENQRKQPSLDYDDRYVPQWAPRRVVA